VQDFWNLYIILVYRLAGFEYRSFYRICGVGGAYPPPRWLSDLQGSRAPFSDKLGAKRHEDPCLSSLFLSQFFVVFLFLLLLLLLLFPRP